MPKEKMIYVYGSNLPILSPEWRAWDCISGSKEGLQTLCVLKYGRVPPDCVPKQESLSAVPGPSLVVHAHDLAKYGAPAVLFDDQPL